MFVEQMSEKPADSLSLLFRQVAWHYLCTMKSLEQQRNERQVAIWLLTGVGMLVIQVLLGGITRLTESGLSITEWKPITGILPPLNDQTWQEEFARYRHTDQFKYVHTHFSLSEFKYIFFWEWFHRFWARMMGIVFAVGFVYFLVKRKMNRKMVMPMVILFFLGGIQGAIGWIMVKSGLVPEKFFVGHIELTTHFLAALVLLSYTLWFALSLLPSFEQKIESASLRKWVLTITALFVVQLMYGGFMAGMKAAATAPTWPSINGHFFPSGTAAQSLKENLFYNPLVVHFIHRGMAYVLFTIGVIFFFRTASISVSAPFRKIRIAFLVLLITQVLLGVSALLLATQPSKFLYVGVAHQFTAMLLVLCLVSFLFLIRGSVREVKA